MEQLQATLATTVTMAGRYILAELSLALQCHLQWQLQVSALVSKYEQS
jgi:hypothetical protein